MLNSCVDFVPNKCPLFFNFFWHLGGEGGDMVHVKKLPKPSEFYSLFTKFITFCFLQIHLGYIMQYLSAVIMMQLKTTVIISYIGLLFSCINHR